MLLPQAHLGAITRQPTIQEEAPDTYDTKRGIAFQKSLEKN